MFWPNRNVTKKSWEEKEKERGKIAIKAINWKKNTNFPEKLYIHTYSKKKELYI